MQIRIDVGPATIKRLLKSGIQAVFGNDVSLVSENSEISQLTSAADTASKAPRKRRPYSSHSAATRRFRDYLDQRGLSLEKMAAYVGVTTSAIRLWSHRNTTPRPTALGLVAEYFGVSPNAALKILRGQPVDGLTISKITPTRITYVMRPLGKNSFSAETPAGDTAMFDVEHSAEGRATIKEDLVVGANESLNKQVLADAGIRAKFKRRLHIARMTGKATIS